MFKQIGSFVARYRLVVIALWIALAAGVTLLAPDLASVSSSDQSDFLPADAPFVHAQEVQAAAFPEQSSASSTIIVVDAGPGGNVRTGAWAFIAELEAWLASDQAPAAVTQVAGPAGTPELADKLVSPSGRVALVAAGMDTAMDTDATDRVVAEIDTWLAAHAPADVSAYQSGEAALNAQGEAASLETMDRTLWITLTLVVVALLVIYRSPVSPFIPLLAVTAALVVTLGLSALLARAGAISVLTEVQTILVAVMYGAGTDYCLFLISRFREEMAGDVTAAEATRRTVTLVGETISSSAGTVFVGFASLVLAEMGMFRSAGPMLALGIAVMLLAGLTLVPALLAVLGNHAFWPARARHRSSGRFYEMTSKLVSSRPLLTILVIVVLMAPFSAYGLSRDLNYDMISELPADLPAVRGYNLLQDEMGAGVLFPLTVVVTGRDVGAEPRAAALEIARLTAELRAVRGVHDVRGLDSPLGSANGLTDLLRVDTQLRLLLSTAGDGAGTAPSAEEAAAMLAAMRGYLDYVAAHFPELAGDADLAVVREILDGGLMALVMRQGELLVAVERLATRLEAIDDAYLLPPTGEGALLADLSALYDEYLSAGGTAYRLEVVLDDPVGEGGFEAVTQVRRVLERYEGDGEAVAAGLSAVYTDIRDVMSRDTVRAFGFVLAGVFLVLLVMLRSVVAPTYLIATVLLSFTFTLGLTALFFDLVFGVERLSWLLPLFMFVFLVALGIDYSIFLFGRIKEEVAGHGVREGVHVAVAATGSIITSAGIILAGTFAGMMAGEVQFLRQLGFAVAAGVLVDTFVVRTMLDPALAALFGRWTWWPGAVPGEQARRRAAGGRRMAGSPAARDGDGA